MVNRTVWSPAGTSEADGTTVWPRSAKKSTNRLRISSADRNLMRGSAVAIGIDIGANGTEPLSGVRRGGLPPIEGPDRRVVLCAVTDQTEVPLDPSGGVCH